MKVGIKIDPATGQKYMAVNAKGHALLLNPLTNKGTAFTQRERDELNLHGLIPPAISTIRQQLDRTYENYLAKTTNLERYIYLSALQDRNETLFYRLLLEHIEEMMPVVYTPVVGEACQKFGHIYRRGRGVYICYEERHQMEQILRNADVPHPSVIVVTDGERILGLGDQGAGGMGIPIGKLCLYTLCAGISPYSTLPITLDVGTDNEERLKDPLYLGVKHKRIRGEEYQAFIDNFVAAVKRIYPQTLLQWEDFLKGNAIFQLRRFRNELCTFNDDIQGTAGVIVAGLLGALRITGQKMRDQRVVFAGAGASAQGISDLIVAAMVEEGLSQAQARKQVWTVDSQGLVTKARTNLEEFKATYARDVDEIAFYNAKDKTRVTLLETVCNVKPTVLLGTSGTAGTFTQEVVRRMAEINQRPIVFPLSNPTSKSECTAQEAIEWSEGRAIVATGSPFAPVMHNGKKHRIGQGNNAFIFPGVGLGISAGGVTRVSEKMFLEAARALASKVTEQDLAESAVYPQLSRIREFSLAVACATVKQAVKEGYADADVLEDLEESLNRAMWEPKYLPIRYEQ
ncbi:MAG TPA: NAD-dependent malic enzyme [Terriglobales bacterium]|nr:NAD-dependent malic enzyme [Terriglobales bacterium]